ncbi:MAG: F0F1 ATP synthase subunit epsilon [Stappiaceae bacterium]
MAEQFQFELVSPERLLVSMQVDSVVVPGAEGEFQILNAHAPFMSTMRPGVLTVHTGSEEQKYFIRGGFADAGPGGLTVLAELAILVADVKPEDIAQQIKNAEEDVADAADDATRNKAETILNQLNEVKAVLGH